MPGIQGDVKKIKMTQTNFSLPEKVYHEYRNYCKEHGIPMNFPIALFMQQFVAGEFTLRVENGTPGIDIYGDERQITGSKYEVSVGMAKRLSKTGDYRFQSSSSDKIKKRKE